ncbi:hypothetical protein PoB_002623600 [Plakobranchus ocellatus]|uniref:RGS domain-containing protein n=1 Tax=Plakobranchus ocellatus TaxID=259542 RepID=A0AAV3ZYX1_9GAST|nr:hypothetical protein PoB_002623600 [Plakobranchus ocellatus]
METSRSLYKSKMETSPSPYEYVVEIISNPNESAVETSPSPNELDAEQIFSLSDSGAEASLSASFTEIVNDLDPSRKFATLFWERFSASRRFFALHGSFSLDRSTPLAFWPTLVSDFRCFLKLQGCSRHDDQLESQK